MRVRMFSWSRPMTGMRPSANTLARLGAFAILILMLAAALNFGSFAKSAAGKRSAAVPPAEAASNNSDREAASPSALTHMAVPFTPALALPQVTGPSIETYNCATDVAQNVFELGDTVCARATGVPAAAFPEFSWRVSWVDPAGLVVEKDTAATDPTTEYDYPLPNTDTSNIGGAGGITANNRGTWRALLTRSNGSIIATAYFTVRSTERPVSDIYVQKFLSGLNGAISSGSPVKFIVIVANIGPNDAAQVHVTDSLPEGASLGSFSQVGGAQCVEGSSPQDCTIATLASGERAEFEAIYIAGGTVGSHQTTASATTTTAELSTDNNTGTGSFQIITGGTENGCMLECPNDMVVVANSFQGTTHGAVVNFGAAESFGDCGAVTASPASGSFFPVGTTVVSSSSATGGGSCSFSVTVTEEAAPDISCPAPVTAAAESGCSTTVSAAALGTPTTTGGTGTVTVEASRNDSQALDDPYPVGTTTITYTATDSAGRSDTCTQTVTVTSGNDAENPTITAPDDVSFSTGSSGGACGLVVSEAQLGQADAADDGCSVSITRTGMPAGNFFPVGSTTITWVATDAAGKTATDTQVVTITEDTPPGIQAPPDASYTCESEVPAADPSQANGGDPNLPGGGPVTDNCGTATVTVTESRSGAGNASSPLVITRTFTATDASNNSASSVQTITVTDDTPPTVALVGPASVTHECHAPFTDPGVTTGDNCNAAVSVATSGGFDPDAPGTYTITYTATDGVGNTATAQRTVTVVDTIAPVIALSGANPLTWECHTPFTDPGASASDSCDTAVPVVVSGSVNVNVPGTYTLTYNASDDSGNAAATVTRTVNVVDTTNPVISCPANIVVTLPPNSTAVSMPVTFAAPTATDSCDSGVSVATSHASGSTFGVGTTTVTATATDDSGNSASCSFSVTVLYNFTGFFSPISNTVINQANAGRTLPVKFSLSGNKGLDIMAADSPFSRQVPCSTETVNDVTLVETTGNSSLTYSPDQYHFNWKTESSWAGTCRELVVKLNDGSEHTARFKFK